jgi:hypothetical protein
MKSTFRWIQPQAHISLESTAIVILIQRHFLSTMLRHLILTHWSCIKLSQVAHILGLDHIPTTPIVTLPCPYNSLQHECWNNCSSLVSITPPYCDLSENPSYISRNSLFFYLYLPILRLLVGRVSSWLACRAPHDRRGWLIVHHKIVATIGVGVSVVKAHL